LKGLADGRLADTSLLREGPLACALNLLNPEGEETRLVGGAVRDLALGEPPGDFDLTTTMRPEAVMARARAAGLQVIPTGLAHGTVTVMSDGAPIEVTTLREDLSTDGRHAEVAFGRDFRIDALRRDFTINALSIDLDGVVHDYAGGLEDLEARRVRFIGDPRKRIREDFLRILRFFRFSARFGQGELDAEGLAAAIAERDGLAILSRERIRSELLKLLAAPRAAEVVAAAAAAGLLAGPLGAPANSARLAGLIALEAARGEPPDPLLRLAALALRDPADAERLRGRLRLSNGEHARLETIAAALSPAGDATAPPSLGDLRAWLFERGRQGARDAITMAHVESGARADDAGFARAYRFVSDTPVPRLPFSGADIVARGVGPGQRVGAVLKHLQALWIRAGFPKEPEILARLLDEALNA
jgi:poly(A) polymerase